MSSSCYLGTITGTSVDALDMVLVDMADGIHIRAASSVPFPAELREALIALGQPGKDDLDRIGELDVRLGEFIGHSISAYLADQGLDPTQIAAIGSHGQTIRHRPDAAYPFTWQIGDPNRIAELTGITTVADFRRRDMAAGGQGAPLVPPFHAALFGSPDEDAVVLNIGGISNVTWLARDPGQTLTGFDTGPGNALLDAWCQTHTGAAFDLNGQWAATGKVDTRLLARLLRDPYFDRQPPKSTGREYFTNTWLNGLLAGGSPQPPDVQRTLVELTAASVLQAVRRWAAPCQRIIVCGGGRLNGLLMERLTELSAMPVQPTEDLGYDGDAIEAAAFAWLAARRLSGDTGNAPGVTGASGDRVLGAVYAR
jgi:anhydro-N-acetylmuramic acid kinase